jgi:hypothetical protein
VSSFSISYPPFFLYSHFLRILYTRREGRGVGGWPYTTTRHQAPGCRALASSDKKIPSHRIASHPFVIPRTRPDPFAFFILTHATCIYSSAHFLVIFFLYSFFPFLVA